MEFNGNPLHHIKILIDRNGHLSQDSEQLCVCVRDLFVCCTLFCYNERECGRSVVARRRISLINAN